MKKQTLTLLTAFLLAASFLPFVSITSAPSEEEVPNQINPALDISIPRFRESYEFWTTTAITRRDTGEAIYIYDLADVSVDFTKPTERARATGALIKFSVVPNDLTCIILAENVGAFNENYYFELDNITDTQMTSLRAELEQIPVKFIAGATPEGYKEVMRLITPPDWIAKDTSTPITLTITMVEHPINPNASWAGFKFGAHSLEWVLSSAADWDSGTHDNTASWQEKLRLEWPLVSENYLVDTTAIDRPFGVNWSPHDPKLIAAVGGTSDTIAVFSYDNSTKALVRENYLKDNTAIDYPEAVSWSPHDPKLIAAVGSDSDTIAIFSYDNSTKALVRENYLVDATAINGPFGVSWSPHDPKLIAAVGYLSSTIAVFSYDNATKALVRENYLVDYTAINEPHSVGWSPHDPKLIAAVGYSSATQAVFSYDNSTKALVRENYLTVFSWEPRNMSWSPHDPKLIVAISEYETTAVFSYDNATKALVRENYLANTVMDQPMAVSWSPHDPKLIAAVGYMSDWTPDIAVLSYDNATKALVSENYLAYPAIDDPFSVSWSPHDPKLIAAIGATSDIIVVFSGGFKSNGEWTSPWDNLGTTSSKAWLELKLQTNVPSGCDENITVEVGSGGTPSDSKTFNYAENTSYDGEDRIYDISDLAHDEEVRIEFEFSSGSDSPEVELAAVTANPVVNVAPEVLNSYTPSTVDPNSAFDIKVEVRDNDNISDIEEVWLKVFENTKSQGDADSARDHYTFKWIRTGADNWFEVGPDSVDENHIVKASCSAGNDAENTDNFKFNIKLGVTASPNNSWNVWVKVIDNAGAQDNEEFTNKFSVTEYLSLSIDTPTLTFSGNPGETDKAASENPTVCTVDSNTDFKIQVKLNGDWSGSVYGGSIPMANTYADQDESLPYTVTLTAGYQDLWPSVGWGEGVAKDCYWFLDFPLPLRDDVYSTTFYVNVVKA